MSIDEKREKLYRYCELTKCCECILTVGDWEYPLDNADKSCLDIDLSAEKDLDRALHLIAEKEISDLPNVNNESPISPTYYNDTKIAPIDVIEDWDLDFCLGSALKYIKRCGKKENNPSVQDLKKVIWYIERRIKELEEATND